MPNSVAGIRMMVMVSKSKMTGITIAESSPQSAGGDRLGQQRLGHAFGWLGQEHHTSIPSAAGVKRCRCS